MGQEPRIALIHDWLAAYGGAERVLEAALELYPGAPIYTLVHRPQALRGSRINEHEIRSSFLNRLPGAGTAYRAYLPLMPLAIEQFNLQPYDLILSFSSAVAHGVLTGPDQLHINYIYTPARFAWHRYQDYMQFGLASGPRGWLARLVLHYLRLWDLAASHRVDRFVAVSQWIARAVWRAYRREAEVIYPPVDVDRFRPLSPRADYYITVSRLVPQKRIELIVDAFTELDHPLIVVGEGPEQRGLAARAGPNIQLLGWQSEEELQGLLGRARAFVHAAEEDFGIAPMEALASGCPVIAYGKGGLQEALVEGENAVFFSEQSARSLSAAVRALERGEQHFDPQELRRSAERFSKDRFKRKFASFVAGAWQDFTLEATPGR